MTGGYQLVALKNGTWSVRALAEAETFHPVIGPVAEAEALYVRQLRLRERAAAHRGEEFVLWDVGLGAAANVLTALRTLSDVPGRVRVLSFDRTREPLRFAAAHPEPLGYFGELLPAVNELLHAGRAHFPCGAQTVTWDLIEADFPGWLAQAEASTWPAPHAILFDAYSPARNPAMWTFPLFQRLRTLAVSNRPCALATYSRATFLRVTLLRAGWFVGVGHATGEKDETTVAANTLDLISEPLGRVWLDRARRSTSAEPLWHPEYRQQPLSAATWAALELHPQFANPKPSRGAAEDSTRTSILNR